MKGTGQLASAGVVRTCVCVLSAACSCVHSGSRSKHSHGDQGNGGIRVTGVRVTGCVQDCTPPVIVDVTRFWIYSDVCS